MYEVYDASALCDPSLYAPRAHEPEGAMVHTSDGRSSQAWLQGGSRIAGQPASSDFLITRTGKILRLVPRSMHSYHAGVCYDGTGIDRVNHTSQRLVGIEIENADSAGEVPTVDQHKALAGLLLEGAAHFKWSPLTIYGHYGVAYPIGRRSDPHALDWGYVFWLMAHAHDSISLYGANPF